MKKLMDQTKGTSQEKVITIFGRTLKNGCGVIAANRRDTLEKVKKQEQRRRKDEEYEQAGAPPRAQSPPSSASEDEEEKKERIR